MNRSEEPAPQPEKPPRLLSLDVFRGLTILGMILVNNPGSWGDLYAPLGHAAWHGWTPTDLIFPFFLFIVGTSLAYSLRKYRLGERVDSSVYMRIVRRTIVLVLLGLLLGLSGQLFRMMLGQGDSLHWATLRLPGVLQRIALVYLAASFLVLHLGVRKQMAIAATCLLGYWALLAWLPQADNYRENLTPGGNLVRVVDRSVLGDAHLYTQGKTEKTDPEGLLSTLPAIVTTLLGYWVGLLVQRWPRNTATVGLLIGCGALCAVLGLGWGEVLPINKKIWTSSYVLLTGGLATVALAVCLLLFDVWGWRKLARPFEIVGVNAIFVFVASGLVGRLLTLVRIGDFTAKGWIYEHLCTHYIADAQLASFAFAVATVCFWWIVLGLLAWRGWTIRV